VLLLSACGFALRGITPLPFDSLYIGIPDNTRFGADVRRALQAASPTTRFVAHPKDAQAILQQISNQRTLREVSLSPQGRVEEYGLEIQFTFRLIDAQGRSLLADTTLSIYREMPYDANVVQAKQGQTETLFLSMQKELVGVLIRRLTADDVREAVQTIAEGKDTNLPLYDPKQGDPEQNLPPVWKIPHISEPYIGQ
jgi:LPS-assembly lipoprotein